MRTLAVGAGLSARLAYKAARGGAANVRGQCTMHTVTPRGFAQARRTPMVLARQPHAVPPPTSARNLQLQQLYAHERPLLEHETVPAQPHRLLLPDATLAEWDTEVPADAGHWRRRARSVDSATFAAMLDRLSALEVVPRTRRQRRQARRSPAVAAESNRIERMEREADAREEAIASALEHGEDVTRAERLGAEAELVVLGEPNGSQAEWGKGVATHLGTRTEPYQPPSAKQRGRVAYVDAPSMDTMEQDAHLWLSHGLVMTQIRAAREWDAVAARVLGGTPAAPVLLDSVRRKRRKKMNKHKYKKLRKRQRAERQRLKK